MPPKLVQLKHHRNGLSLSDKIDIMDDLGQMNERYQQCAMEIKMENRIIGPLQIHQESMHRLTTTQPAAAGTIIGPAHRDGTVKKTTIQNVASRKMTDPFLSIRSIFTPRRTNNHNTDLSKVVLPGRRGSNFCVPAESSVGSRSGRSSVVARRMRKQHNKELLEGLSDLDYDSVNTPPSIASRTSLPHTRDRTVGKGGGNGGSLRRRSSRRAKYVRKKSSTSTTVDNVGSDSDSMIGESKRIGISSTDEEQGGDLGQAQQDIPVLPRERLGKRRSSLFAVDERRASVDHDDCGVGAVGLVRGCGGESSSSCENSIANEARRRGSSIEGKDGTSLICKFPSRNTSPGYSGDDDTLICDWGRRQSNVSSASSLSNSEEFSHHCDKEKQQASASLICGWNESEVSILSESTSSSTDEKVLQHAVKSCTLFDVRRH